MTEKQVIQIIKESKIIAVLSIEDPEDACPVADALAQGGIKTFELLLRTEKALKALDILLRNYPEIVTSAGTVLTTKQLQTVCDLGAAYAVSPGLNPEVVRKAAELNLPFFPGVATPSDIEGTLRFNKKLLKFFPAAGMGGLKYLEAMQAPYAYLGIKYIPLGGVKPENLAEFVRSPIVAAVGGSWLAHPKDIANKDWKKIRKNAEEAVKIIQFC